MDALGAMQDAIGQGAQVAPASAPHPPAAANDVATSSSYTTAPPGPPAGAADKMCKWWAKGFCARGDECWFKHGLVTHASNNRRQPRLSPDAPVFQPAASPVPPTDTTAGPSSDAILAATEEQPACGICFDESPASYGLLESCSHAFCLSCLREWRAAKKCNTLEDEEDAAAGGRGSNTKACPACRQRSHYIIPSSTFHSNGEAKDLVVSRYKAALGAKPCKYFEAGKSTSRGPFCPFGDECLYSHTLTPGDDRYLFGGGFQHMYELSKRDRDAKAEREFARALGRIVNRHRPRRPRRRRFDADLLDLGLDIAFEPDAETLMAIANAGLDPAPGAWADPFDAEYERQLMDLVDDDQAEEAQQEGDRELRRMMIDSYGEDLDPRAAERRDAENRAMVRDLNRALGPYREDPHEAQERPRASPRSQRRRAQRAYNRQHRDNAANADGANAQAGPSHGRANPPPPRRDNAQAGPSHGRAIAPPPRRIAPLPGPRNNRNRDAFATPAADFDYYDDPAFDGLDYDDDFDDDDWDRRQEERLEELYMYGYRFDEDPDEFEDMLYAAGVYGNW